MLSSELWNGFRYVGTPGSITNGAVRLTDTSTVQGSKYESTVVVKGGDKIEFTVMARAISGIGSLYCQIVGVTDVIADVKITGHDDWRAYKLSAVIPIHYNVAECLIGVGVYTADIGDIEVRLPTIKVNGKEPVAKTVKAGLRAGPGTNDLYLVVDGLDVARIYSDGSVSFQKPGATSFPPDPVTSAVNGCSINNGSGPGVVRAYQQATDSAVWGRGSVGVIHRFLYVTGPATSTGVGNINVTTTSTNYQTSSDYRLKKQIKNLTGSGEFIDALQPRSWTWTIDGSAGSGFIAHELQTVSPTSVFGEKDAINEDGTPEYQSVSYSSAEIITNMVAELQALRKRVMILENK